MDQPRRRLQSTSSSSAVDLTGTPAGLAVSLPPSPSLSPKDGSVARRRPSWSAPRVSFPHPTEQMNTRTFSIDDDPFASPVSPDDDTPPRSRAGSAYLTNQAGPSSASLIPMVQEDEDDETHLTPNATHRYPPGWSIYDVEDPEHSISASPKSRRKSNRYSSSPSPLRKTGTTLQSVSRSLRHMSIRVVNLAGRGLDDHVRLDDEDEEISPKRKGDDDPGEPEDPALPDLRKSLPIRGRTLHFMGPSNRIRLFMYRLLLFPCVVSPRQRVVTVRLQFAPRWTEPIVLLLILFHFVVLSIQSARYIVLANANATPPQGRSYFNQWEDYAIFALFIFFTYVGPHDFVKSRSLCFQYRMLRTDMCLRPNSRPRSSLRLHLHFLFSTPRRRTYPYLSDSQPLPHSAHTHSRP